MTIRRDGRIEPIRIRGNGNQLTGAGLVAQPVEIGDRAAIAPGDEQPGTLTVNGDISAGPNTSWVFDFRDAAGIAGTDWDLVVATGNIALSDSAPTNFVIRGTGGPRGDVLNFDPTQPQRWVLARGAISNAFAIGESNVVTRGFNEQDFPEHGRLDVFADSDGIFLQYSTLRGDFDHDGQIDVDDVEALNDWIQSGSYHPTIDLNEDGSLNENDRVIWVESIARTYFGDSNLDGEFNSSDFVNVFAAGRYENGNADWSTGDWNGDRMFDSSDFVLAFQHSGYEKGPRPVAVVPETTGYPTIVVFLAVIGVLRAKAD